MHPVELHPLQIPEPGGLSATISGVPIETFLAPSGTGGGRRRAGLRGVAALLSGMGIETVGLVVAGEEEVQPEAGVFACPLPTLGGTMEWVGHQEHQNALVDVAGLFADRAPEPTDGPKLWTLGRVIIVDLCIGHRRPGFCILMGPAAALRPVPVPDLPLRSFLLAVSGMLRADAWRRTIERLVDSLARTSREASGPVTSAQEAAAWAARFDAWNAWNNASSASEALPLARAACDATSQLERLRWKSDTCNVRSHTARILGRA